VLTLTPQYVAQALCKALPVTLEEIEEYAQKNGDRLRAIAHEARACGRNAKVLD
jgi:5-enolpyruvylshikimate-3-phosphate synthase